MSQDNMTNVQKDTWVFQDVDISDLQYGDHIYIWDGPKPHGKLLHGIVVSTNDVAAENKQVICYVFQRVWKVKVTQFADGNTVHLHPYSRMGDWFKASETGTWKEAADVKQSVEKAEKLLVQRVKKTSELMTNYSFALYCKLPEETYGKDEKAWQNIETEEDEVLRNLNADDCYGQHIYIKDGYATSKHAILISEDEVMTFFFGKVMLLQLSEFADDKQIHIFQYNVTTMLGTESGEGYSSEEEVDVMETVGMARALKDSGITKTHDLMTNYSFAVFCKTLPRYTDADNSIWFQKFMELNFFQQLMSKSMASVNATMEETVESEIEIETGTVAEQDQGDTVQSEIEIETGTVAEQDQGDTVQSEIEIETGTVAEQDQGDTVGDRDGDEETPIARPESRESLLDQIVRKAAEREQQRLTTPFVDPLENRPAASSNAPEGWQDAVNGASLLIESNSAMIPEVSGSSVDWDASDSDSN